MREGFGVRENNIDAGVNCGVRLKAIYVRGSWIRQARCCGKDTRGDALQQGAGIRMLSPASHSVYMAASRQFPAPLVVAMWSGFTIVAGWK